MPSAFMPNNLESTNHCYKPNVIAVYVLQICIDGSGYMLTDESGKSKLLACQTEERQNDPECHHA